MSPVPENESFEVRQKLAAAKIAITERLPYLAMAAYALQPVPVKEGLPFAASDKYWRLYYNPEYIKTAPVDEVAGVIVHEIGHCLRAHADRFTAMQEPRSYHTIFNVAGDLTINEDVKNDGFPLPDGVCWVEDFVQRGYAVDTTYSAEQNYAIIKKKQEEDKENCPDCQNGSGDGNGSGEGSGSGESEDGSGDGSGSGKCPKHGNQNGSGNGSGSGEGDNLPEPGCGSSAHGQEQEWDLPFSEDNGVSEDRGEGIRNKTAHEIDKHQKNIGNVSAGWERFAKDLLTPVVDWRKELATVVRRELGQVAGLRDYTYSRPSRRTPALRGQGQNIILPALRQPRPPVVSVVIDTSGSMSDAELTYGLSEVKGVLKTLGSAGRNVNVITCDTAAHAQVIRKVEDIKLVGGGGTDMRVGIDACVKSNKLKPDALILITDGYTPYPDEPIPGVTLIVALTEEGAKDEVPTWARTVFIEQPIDV